MALNDAALRDLIDAKYAAINTDYASSDDRNVLKNGLMMAIAQAVNEHLRTSATVAFTAGAITGTDSHGDTHTTLTASGGTIS